MKTWKEWLADESFNPTKDKSWAEWICKIQLDSWKQGMTDAALSCPGTVAGMRIANKILEERDRIQELE